MPNPFFAFKQFTIHQDQCAMKVTTDACLFGAWAISETHFKKKNFQLLDIGAGTGLLSLLFAQQYKEAIIEGIELDAAAAQQAKQNVDDCEFGNNVNIIHSDINSYSPTKSYDIIISNPPFYEKDLVSNSPQRNWAFHDQGLKLKQLLYHIDQLLTPDGVFFLLLPPKRESELLQHCKEYNLKLINSCAVHATDTKAAHCLFYKGQKGEAGSLLTQVPLIIQGNEKGYSSRAHALLANYYLHL